MLPEFQKFPKIPRLNRDIIITEKIDGTNAQVLITEDERVIPGSRNRWLTTEQDNYGFAAWVRDHQDELLELGPGRHFGEWWGQGINRGYGLDHRRFSLFNVSRWAVLSSEWIIAKCSIVPVCCDVVPILYVGPWNDDKVILQYGEEPRIVENVLHRLSYMGSTAAPGFMRPEGIVIYHTAGNYLFKVTLENDEKPKGNQ